LLSVLLLIGIPFLTLWIVSSAVTSALTPADHTRYGSYSGTEAQRSLTAEGYSITADWSSNAVSKLKNK
jgi:hypothetical protein